MPDIGIPEGVGCARPGLCLLAAAQENIGTELKATYVQYELHTNARLDRAQYVFEFGGQQFCLVRGTDSTWHELYTIMMGMPNDRSSVDELVQRLCDWWGWAWKNGVHLSGGEGIGVSEDTALEELPLLSASRSGPRGSVITPHTAPDAASQSEAQAEALSLWNEAACSRSPFLSMFNYWKILELPPPELGVVKGKPEKRAIGWIDRICLCPSKICVPDEIQKVLAQRSVTPGQYLYDQCRNAISHVTRKPVLRTHKMQDRLKIDRAARFAGRLAEHYMYACLKVEENMILLQVKGRQRRKRRLHPSLHQMRRG